MSEHNTTNAVDGITLVTEPAAAYLNERQLVDYRAQRRDCLEWLLALGKAPEKGKGYARGTVKPRSHRMDMFYRWLWDREDGYTADIRPDHADAWMRALATEDTSRAHKANCQKAVQRLLKWRHHAHGIDTQRELQRGGVTKRQFRSLVYSTRVDGYPNVPRRHRGVGLRLRGRVLLIHPQVY